MTKRSRKCIQDVKQEKKRKTGRVVKEKFAEARAHEAEPIIARNAKQKHYLKELERCNVIIAEGLFGTGKSFLAAAVAADALRDNTVEKVVVARAYVQTGNTAGFRPGSTLEKLFPYVRNILDTMKGRMGVGAYTCALKDGLTGSIEVQALEDIRGRSFDAPSYLIIDEAQQTTPEEMLSIVTRISDDCKLVLCGDDSQRDIRGQSGLAWFKAFAKRHNLSSVGFVEFNSPDDIVRGGLVKEIAMGLARDDLQTF